MRTFSDGSFVVVWQSHEQDGSGYGIQGQKYDANGNKISHEFRINKFSVNDQVHPSTGVFSDDSFLVIWQSHGQDGSGYGIYAQRYNAQGSEIGGEFLVNTHTSGIQQRAKIGIFSNDKFVVVWEGDKQDGLGYELYGQKYDENSNKIGSEFSINSYSNGDQRIADIATFPKEEFIVTWESDGQDGSGYGIYGQRFSGDLTKMGSEFLVNSCTSNAQQNPVIRATGNSSFLISWSSYGYDGCSWGVYVQRYQYNDGSISATPASLSDSTAITQLGANFLINTYTNDSQDSPSVAVFSDENFVVVWQSNGQDGSGYGIYGRIYNATTHSMGTHAMAPHEMGCEFKINKYSVGDQKNAAVEVLKNGDFVVGWESDGQDGSGYGIYIQRYDNNGDELGTEFLANTYTIGDQTNAVIKAFNDVGFIVAWQSAGRGIHGQRYGATANKIGHEFQINGLNSNDQKNPQIGVLSNNKFIVTWQAENFTGSGYDVYARKFDAQGNKEGEKFLVNTYIQNDQHNPNIAIFSDDSSIITWESYGQDGSEDGIYAQRYDINGTKIELEFKVNKYSYSIQRNPHVYAFPDKEYVILWESYGQDKSEYGVYAQRYNSNGYEIGGEFLINSQYPLNSQMNGILAPTVGVVIWQSDGQDGSGYGIYAQKYGFSDDSESKETKTIPETIPETINEVIITSGGTYTGTPGNDRFVINTLQNVTIISDSGRDEFVVHLRNGGNTTIPDFDYANDKIIYLSGECPGDVILP